MRSWSLSAIRLLLLAMLIAYPANATITDFAGRWALRSQGRTLVLFELKRGVGTGVWTGSSHRPETMNYTTGSVFQIAKGPLVMRTLTGAEGPDGTLKLSVARKPGEPADSYTLEPVGSDHVALQFSAADIPALPLVRAKPAETVAADWDIDTRYSVDANWPANLEMKAMFDADQAGRSVPDIDWTKLSAADSIRRLRTKALLSAGKLRSGDDFWHAAFVFQHGGESESYLLAHSLAIIAVARGRSDATWIAAATLDRYLNSVGQKQIYGTQYSIPPDQPATQEPYDRLLLSDTLRLAFGVPTLATQERQRAEYDARTKNVKSAK